MHVQRFFPTFLTAALVSLAACGTEEPEAAGEFESGEVIETEVAEPIAPAAGTPAPGPVTVDSLYPGYPRPQGAAAAGGDTMMATEPYAPAGVDTTRQQRP